MASSDKKFKEIKYPHQGHRQRMRSRFEKEHETMSDVDIVEMLLYYAVPRADTRKQAKAEWLKRFEAEKARLAEEKRIADEKAAEEKRIADEKAMQNTRLLEEIRDLLKANIEKR